MKKGKKYNKTIDFYNKYAKEYAEKIEKHPPLRAIESFTKLLNAGTDILDVACGAGRDTRILTIKGYKVVGIDISEGMIREARRRSPEIDFIKMDMLRLSFKDSMFDGVYASAALIHFKSIRDVKTSLSEFHRVLKPDGILHVRVKAPRQKGLETEVIKERLTFGEGRLTRYFTKSSIRKLIEGSGFEVVDLFSYSKSYKKLRRNLKWIVLNSVRI